MLWQIEEIKASIKFQLKKVLCLGVAIGHVAMADKVTLRSTGTLCVMDRYSLTSVLHLRRFGHKISFTDADHVASIPSSFQERSMKLPMTVAVACSRGECNKFELCAHAGPAFVTGAVREQPDERQLPGVAAEEELAERWRPVPQVVDGEASAAVLAGCAQQLCNCEGMLPSGLTGL